MKDVAADSSGPVSYETAAAPPRFTRRSLLGGIGGAIVASACCLPGAVSLAIGASLGTAASLYRLQEYQLPFRVAGLALALGWSTWLLRRSRKRCSSADHQRNQSKVPLLVLGSFAAAFMFIDLVVIPWLERI